MIKKNQGIISEILLKYLNSDTFYNSALGRVSGSAYKALTIEKIKNSVFPLPPFSEQKAIVEKVTALMQLCDALESEIAARTVSEGQLMEGALREVLAV